MAYIYDICPMFNYLIQLEQSESKWREKWMIAKRNMSTSPPKHPLHLIVQSSQAEIVQSITMLANKSGLSIQKIKVMTREKPFVENILLIRLISIGNFKELYAFISAIEQQSYPASIQDFSYKLTKQNQLLLSMVILSNYKKRQYFPQVSTDNLNNPFCQQKGMELLLYKNDLLESRITPLMQIKMVGYFKQDKRSQALLSLPNKTLIFVEPGSVIGQEQGVVNKINRHQVQVKLINGKKVIIK
jgi:hypothetical protein